MKIKTLLICTLAALFATQSSAQNSAQKSGTRDAQAAAQPAPAAAPDATTPDDPKFAAFAYDVASIKPHKDDNSGRNFSGSSQPDDGYSATNTTLRNLIFAAYSSASHSELSGGPNWINEDRFDIEARFDAGTIEALKKLSPRDRRLARQHMLQMFLKERVRVEVRLSTKEVPSFDLVVGKGGLKIKEAPDPNEDGHGSAMMSVNQSMATMTAKAVPLSMLTGQLTVSSGRPVFDKTGLTGVYDFTLQYAPMLNGAAVPPNGSAAGTDTAMPQSNGPSFQDAIEERLGLKLVPSRGMIQLIVVDHVERPSAN
jgi:bla regulator protein blaR1